MSEWVLYARVIYLKFLYEFEKIKTLNIVSDSLMTLWYSASNLRRSSR